MRRSPYILLACAGFAAGSINGLFGAGGGMVLLPLLSLTALFREESLFPSSVCIMASICLISIFLGDGSVSWRTALPYLLGSAAGGILSGLWGRRIPVRWLHLLLGGVILWGGWRYLC